MLYTLYNIIGRHAAAEYDRMSRSAAAKLCGSLVALLLSCVPFSSQAQINLGYCKESITSSAYNTNAGVTLSSAMALTPAQWEDYSFCDVSAIRIGLYEVEGITQVKVWVREHLRGNDLCSVTLDATQFERGWNTFPFEEALSFEGHDTLYFGYDYTQQVGKVKAIGVSGTKNTRNSNWLGYNGKWTDQSSKHAPACIQAVLTSRYQDAAMMRDLHLDRRSLFCDQQDSLTVTGSIRNLGSQPLNSFELTYADTTLATQTLHFDLPALAFGQSLSFQFAFLPQSQYIGPDIPLTLHLSLPNGQANEYQQPEVTLFYERGSQDPTFRNPILVEEFTSLDNGYAALGVQRLRESIEEAHRINLGDNYEYRDQLDGYTTRYILLSRHQGYGPADALRVTEGSDYQPVWFGPQELTFAPAVWINRKGIPISTTLPVDSLALQLSQGRISQYLTTIVDSIAYDAETRTLQADVTTLIHSLGQMEDPRVMCILVENSNQNYPQKDYFGLDEVQQQNIVRSYLSPSSQTLFSWANREAVMAGQARLAEQGASYDPFCMAYTITHHFSCRLPDDLDMLSGLSLVTYVYDAAHPASINGVNSIKVE